MTSNAYKNSNFNSFLKNKMNEYIYIYIIKDWAEKKKYQEEHETYEAFQPKSCD